jgi:hypothetical protein
MYKDVLYKKVAKRGLLIPTKNCLQHKEVAKWIFCPIWSPRNLSVQNDSLHYAMFDGKVHLYWQSLPLSGQNANANNKDIT